MSREATERQYKGTSKNGNRPVNAKKATFVVFRPDAEERKLIKADTTTVDQLLSQLIKRVLEGNKLSIGYRAENDSVYVHLRDGSTDWDKAVTLSVFHNDYETAVRTMCFGLRTRYAEFPDVQLNLFDDDVNW